MTRDDFPELLKQRGLNGIWAELGVARGNFTEKLALHPSADYKLLYAIDRWTDRAHTEQEYQLAREKLSKLPKTFLLRKTFIDAAKETADGILDFCYIDGYAHTGQDDGKTLELWWPKVKEGGIFAGHDYDANQYPKNVIEVNRFLQSVDKIHLLNTTDEEHLKSWWVIK